MVPGQTACVTAPSSVVNPPAIGPFSAGTGYGFGGTLQCIVTGYLYILEVYTSRFIPGQVSSPYPTGVKRQITSTGFGPWLPINDLSYIDSITTIGSNGIDILPSGLRILYGSKSVPQNLSLGIKFDYPFTILYNVQATIAVSSTDATVAIASMSNTNFMVNVSSKVTSSALMINWLAIGR